MTVWANAGANQFHRPDGKPHAQVLDGVITLVYSDLGKLRARVEEANFLWDGKCSENQLLLVTDPFGNKFCLEERSEDYRDLRGSQPGKVLECLGIQDLLLFTPPNANMERIARFYETSFRAPILELSSTKCVVSVRPQQTLSCTKKEGIFESSYTDLRDDGLQPPEGYSPFLSNYGPHVSIYVNDLASCYRRAEELGIMHVNRRFKRLACRLEEAIDDCMFRDPNRKGGIIFLLEHEVRSVVMGDGSLYKSCPLDQIPDGCMPQQ